MLVIRFQRIGKKHQPSYRIAVAERRSKLGAPAVEDLGSYNPFSKKAALKADRIKHWLGVGAKASPTVHNLFVKEGIVNAPRVKIYMKKPAAVAAAPEAAPAEQSVPVESASAEVVPVESAEPAPETA